MVPAYLRWSSDRRGGVRCRLERGFPRRGCGGQRGAKPHLTSSSFRTFRSATRSPGGRRDLYQLPSTAKPAAAKREAAQCDNHPDNLRAIRHGTAVTRIAEEHSVPEGKAKSEQAPIRQPPSRGGPLHRSAPKRPFLLDRARPVFFSARRKRKWAPWREPAPPWPPFGGPSRVTPAGRCVPANNPW